jgi:hypothetical protein
MKKFELQQHERVHHVGIIIYQSLSEAFLIRVEFFKAIVRGYGLVENFNPSRVPQVIKFIINL